MTCHGPAHVLQESRPAIDAVHTGSINGGMEASSPRGSGAGQRDGFFRTGGNAKPAGMTGIGVRSKRLLPAMRETLELSAQAQAAPQFGFDRPHREYVVGTDRDAFLLAFAAIPVDDRPNDAWFLFAVRLLDCH